MNQEKIDKICEVVWNIPNEKWKNKANSWNYTAEVNGMEVLLFIGETEWPAIYVDNVYVGGKEEENNKLKSRLVECFRYKKEGGEYPVLIDKIYNSLVK